MLCALVLTTAFSTAASAAHVTINKTTTAITAVGDQARGVESYVNGAGQRKFVAVGKCDLDSCVVRYNNDLTLDTSFNASGIVSNHLARANQPTWSDEFIAIAVQADQKIVAVGKVQVSSGGNQDFLVARYKTDGTLDTTGFNDSNANSPAGTVYVSFGTLDVPYDVKIDDNGRIVVVGYTGGSSGAMVRLNTNGSLDNTCGTGGTSDCKLTQTVRTRTQFKALAIHDQQITAVGYSDDNSTATRDTTLVRYNDDFTLDTSFGSSGIVTTNLSGGISEDAGWAITIDNSDPMNANRVLVASGKDSLNSANLHVARYTANGSLDTSFDGDGMYTYVTAMNARNIFVQSNGNILVTGGTGSNFKVMSLTPAATVSLDTSFNSGGATPGIYTDTDSSSAFTGAVGLMSDKRVVMVSRSTWNASTDTDFSVLDYAW